MELRPLGKCQLEVSELCLGTMQFLWTADRKTSFQILDTFLEAGGNFLDTANVYTNWVEGGEGGQAESVIGEWMKERGNRDRIVLATKVRGRMGKGPDGQGLGKDHILNAVEGSLRRLQIETIDLYQAHWADTSVPILETLEAFDTLVRQGKVRFIGASNYDASWRLMEALAVSENRGLAAFVSYQPRWNLVERSIFEMFALPLCRNYGLGVIPYSPMAGGFLTGKYRKDKPLPDSCRAEGLKKYLTDRNMLMLDQLEKIGKGYQKTIAQVALAWLLTQPVTTATIIGANTVEQLKESLGAVGFRLTREEMKEIQELTQYEKPMHPVWD